MRKSLAASIDWKLFAPVIVLCVISLATLLSVNFSYFRSQLLFLLFSLIVYFLLTQINIAALARYSLYLYFAGIIAFALVLVLGIESHGAVRWLDIFGSRIQFSEIFKPLLAVCLSYFLARHASKSPKKFIGSLLLLLPVVGLIILQPDLGSAMIYLFAALFLLVIFGFPWYLFAAGIIGVAGVLPVIWQFLHTYQRQRILSYIHPTSDPLGTSYNAIQSVIAVGSGNLTGLGLWQGTQSVLRFLPERQTDFIFATTTEGLGFIGAIIILACFFFLLWRIYKIFLTSQDGFNKNFAAACFGLLLTQIFINIGMNIGMLPVVGVPLPFVSYGGSSLLANFLLIGLLTATIKEDSRSVLEIH